MNQKTKLIPLTKIFFPRLLPLIGQKQYDRTLEKYRLLYTRYDLPANRNLQKHLINGILPGLALYQVLLDDGKSQQEALEKIDIIFASIFDNYRKRLQTIGRIPCAYFILKASIKNPHAGIPC